MKPTKMLPHRILEGKPVENVQIEALTTEICTKQLNVPWGSKSGDIYVIRGKKLEDSKVTCI